MQKAQTAKEHSKDMLGRFGINGADYGQGAGYDENCTTDFSGQEELDVYWYHPDHLGSSSFITGIDGEVNQNIEYFPSGETFVENHLNSYNKPYKFNAKELDDETGYYYYGARYYNPRVSLWLNVDPLAEVTPNFSPYAYALNNPIKYVDPTGMIAEPPSTDVIKNKDGTYTVVGAKKDNDNNVYVVNDKGKRTGEVIAQTMTPYDFMMTNDSTGEFYFDKNASGVTFDLNNLGITASVDGNTIVNGDARALFQWGRQIFTNAIENQNPATFVGELQILKNLSANYDPNNTTGGKGILDIKSSLGLNKYTPVQNGTTADGKPILTTLRGMGNMIFGANLKATKPFFFLSMDYYHSTMTQVGLYNQKQNGGNGYNRGYPYYGEHTYSGSYIFMGYWKHFYGK